MVEKSYLHEHEICNQPDDEIFSRQCRALEENVPGLEKGELVQTFEISRQHYTLNGHEIVVENIFDDPYWEMGVFVRSDVDLLPFFLKAQDDKPSTQAA